eukprot:CAMPEP_0175835816 /NCGR_PEP_ID=MMETSP0107_2-20121207/16804_1 /TAXON_ID=195067 ORGANISM="Goniomonas pacifica, Strain CCMP1869" /NCGR_SAMPLE_ID=MMETSP0107_2 /ASSEMBLY_ACC=CAM_ASM_000203 /LENGTH=54 /DNA_ID=CAMNT_0017149155 /DNA_START=69 /DNA_END=229 /DNA_ORIENTATION=+
MRPVTGFPAAAFPHTALLETQTVPVPALAPIETTMLPLTCPTLLPTTVTLIDPV